MKQRNILWEYTEALIIAILLALVIRAFVVQAYKIPSGSMMNTLLVGDYLLVTRYDYGIKIPFTDKELINIGDPHRGDIIVFKYPQDTSVDYIKRVIGVPGDVVEIRGKQLYRNGEKITNEPYVRHADPGITRDGRDFMSPIVVPAGHYFVLGDNRDDSKDSRYWGFVPRKNIQGKALVIYWSWESLTDIRWGRLGTLLR